MRRSLSLLIALLWLPGALLADAPVVQKMARTVSSASVFPIDTKQEVAFRQRYARPAITRKQTDKERTVGWLQFLQDEQDFLATQRKNPAVLTDVQWQGLAAILQDKENYFQGSFNVVDEKVCAVEARSADGGLMIVLGHSLVSILTPGKQDNALLNEQGAARLRAWEKSVGVLKDN